MGNNHRYVKNRLLKELVHKKYTSTIARASSRHFYETRQAGLVNGPTMYTLGREY
jgi:hypothetical protein